jgi:hypothetical protein
MTGGSSLRYAPALVFPSHSGELTLMKTMTDRDGQPEP